MLGIHSTRKGNKITISEYAMKMIIVSSINYQFDQTSYLSINSHARMVQVFMGLYILGEVRIYLRSI